MERLKLKNNLSVVLDKRNSDTVTVMLTVKTGSNYEKDDEQGISHLLEHSVFNGTNKRKSYEIANEIERVGGEMNAATSNDKTFFYTKVLPKHLKTALDVLSDVIFNPSFPEAEFKREKKVVAQEISMIYDNYDFYKWVVFQNTLFTGPQKKPVYGSIESVLSFTRKKLISYYNDFYNPDNIILVITGKIPVNAVKLIKRFFSFQQRFKTRTTDFLQEPEQKQIVKKVKLHVNTSYLVLGYKVPELGRKEALIFDIINAILGRGQSGRLFNEIRNKKGLAYSIGSEHLNGLNYNFFAAYANTKNIEKVKKLILKEFRKLQRIDERTLKEAKTFIEGHFTIANEDGIERANKIASWEIKNKDVDSYIRRIKTISRKDVENMAKKYLSDNYCMIVLEQ